ncbi:MAG: PDDEXK nuclease domain-containing protein [Desulfuromonadaceae bacterium]|nr:PDDEXK nuclease domain-containing protein [Desulfuromonadaceae bacterium]MDD2854634.1 PDDEXK nuclease domain-containing protein [Desulfuromonadaceae bacterium]
MKTILSAEYSTLLLELKERIHKAQYAALKAVNKELIALYWDIGKSIVTRQNNLGWGKSVVETLARDLQNEFPGILGFSARNLWNMRTLYLAYQDNQKLQPLVAEISWTKNVIIMERCKDLLQREFYLKMTKKFGWTKDVLINQLGAGAFERFMMNQTNFDKSVPAKYRHQAKLAVKDEYTFDFLELAEEHSEKELERSLVDNVRKFLVEMGGFFTFVGNQYRLEIDGSEFFIDLLLYHRQLRCLVAIELKIGAFKPEYAGKMQFYLSALNDTVRLSEENPSIGIILCKEKSRTFVEYALQDSNKPIGVSTYSFSTKLPRNLKKYLPSSEEMIKRLEGLAEMGLEGAER